MSKVKISIVGVGHLGSIHAKLASENEALELVGLYDSDFSKSEKLANELNCEAFDNLEKTFDNCEATVIAAPTTCHGDIAAAALERGVSCFIEKPIADSSEKAEKIISLAEKNDLIVQVGHVERFNPALLALKNRSIAPLFVEAHRLSPFKPRALDVSVVFDLMIHDIDIALFLIKSKVAKIDANGVAVLTKTPDICSARIAFENGAVANLTASRLSAKPMRKFRIFQKDSYISLDFANQETEIYAVANGKEPNESAEPAFNLGNIGIDGNEKNIVRFKPKIPKINALAEEQTAFARAVKGKIPPPVGAREAAEALRIAEAINETILNSAFGTIIA